MTVITQAPPNGTPTWVDLGIPDHRRAMEFYGAVFGWEFGEEGPPETGNYTMCLVQGKPVAALMKNSDPDATDFWWNMYFATDDCDGAAKRITDAGGQIPMAPMDVMEQGRMAIAVDPAGGQFGLWEARVHIGAQVVNEPGAMVWNELVTAKADAARDFYTAVFDFTLEPMAGFDYTVLHRPDQRPIGGIQGEPSAPKSAWLTYFDVADTDATLQRATAAGATVTLPAQDTPFGRMAGLRDPFGAEFRIIESAQQS
ncbi:VOC family protein [Nocardia sp. CWNU-33]|uniref:VOC family protein n=1 Tax=Nocardia sp. CWNU-33 TaxID=3392117 RepID=UPI00398EE8B1